jgi:hypothetical protein
MTATLLRCPSCGTEQMLTAVRTADACLICGQSFADGAEVAPAFVPNRSNPRAYDDSVVVVNEVDSLPDIESNAGGLAAAAGLVKEEATFATTPPELEELIASDKRVRSIIVLIPFWGLWRLRRSDVHSPSEKRVLGGLSLFLTAFLMIGVAAARPSASERANAMHARVEASISALHELVREYRAQHGEFPDAAVWRRSAESADSRFYDPWGRIYGYERQGDSITISTLGRDGAAGGRGEDTDVSARFSAHGPA